MRPSASASSRTRFSGGAEDGQGQPPPAQVLQQGAPAVDDELVGRGLADQDGQQALVDVFVQPLLEFQAEGFRVQLRAAPLPRQLGEAGHLHQGGPAVEAQHDLAQRLLRLPSIAMAVAFGLRAR